jgi:hypothetical protein
MPTKALETLLQSGTDRVGKRFSALSGNGLS